VVTHHLAAGAVGIPQNIFLCLLALLILTQLVRRELLGRPALRVERAGRPLLLLAPLRFLLQAVLAGSPITAAHQVPEALVLAVISIFLVRLVSNRPNTHRHILPHLAAVHISAAAVARVRAPVETMAAAAAAGITALLVAQALLASFVFGSTHNESRSYK
jgi:hypothetical protein